ncbi:MAG: protein kinase [Deltaproteobacteria bacterium]|nr:protein kinase [Deltaproteobacteria bacterium]
MTTFGFQKGRILSQKYEIIDLLGSGYEGEVYKIKERATDIFRAAKFFFPNRNHGNISLKNYAKKLHRLSECPILVQYKTTEFVQHKGQKLPYLVSDFIDGILLSTFVTRFPGKRLPYYHGLSFFYELVEGLSQVHDRKSFHGDIHSDNVMIHSFGLKHKMKLIDFHDIGVDKRIKMKEDIHDIIYLFHEILGGSKHYKNHPEEIKYILCGKKRNVIDERFKNMRQLKLHIENMRFRSIL